MLKRTKFTTFEDAAQEVAGYIGLKVGPRMKAHGGREDPVYIGRFGKNGKCKGTCKGKGKKDDSKARRAIGAVLAMDITAKARTTAMGNQRSHRIQELANTRVKEQAASL